MGGNREKNSHASSLTAVAENYTVVWNFRIHQEKSLIFKAFSDGRPPEIYMAEWNFSL